jgi:hypothetical protein
MSTSSNVRIHCDRLQLFRITSFLLALPVLVLPGCSSRPEAVGQLELDPDGAATKALQRYDRNSDGSLSKEEIAEVASLVSAFSRFDKNSDELLSKDELASRFRSWVESASAAASVPIRVWLDDQPLVGAEVTFEPESFLADEIPPASGMTSEGGHVVPTVAKDKLPDHLKHVDVMRLGLYRVKITHPSKSIPAKYNTNTTRGMEVHPGTQGGITEFRLKSN